MNQIEINRAIRAMGMLVEHTQLPEHYKNDVQIDYHTLLIGDVACEFGLVLRTSGTFLDNPMYDLDTHMDNKSVIQDRHKFFSGMNEIRYFWYSDGFFTEVSLQAYCSLFEMYRRLLRQGKSRV